MNATGDITAYRARAGLVVEVAEASAGLPVVMSDYDGVVLVPRTGSATVDKVDLRLRGPRAPFVEDSQTFPVRCCRNFRVVGFTQFSEVIVDTAEGPWVWDSAEGQEGVPYLVPDSDEFIEPLELPSSAFGADLLRADNGDSIFFRDRRDFLVLASPEGEGRYPRGLRRFTTFYEAEFSGAAQYALVRRKSEGLDVVDLERYVTRRLPLPTEVTATFVRWDHQFMRGDYEAVVLMDVTDETGARAIVRCAATTATCVRVQDLPSDAVLATYR